MALLVMGLTISCVSFEPGIEVRVRLLAPRAVIGDGLTSAAVLVEEVELVPCETAQRASFGAEFFSTAYAHGSTVPPEMLDLRSRRDHELDILAPGPGRYCGLLLHLGTPTEDAAWVTGERDRRASQQDVYLTFDEAREYHQAVVDEVVVDYDPREWMLHGDFSQAFRLRED